jgi:hypothetical protein
MNETIKVGGWTGWGSGAKRNGGGPLRFIAPSHNHIYFTTDYSFTYNVSVNY